MPFATNANYTSAVNPIDIGQPTKVVPPDILNGFKPEGTIPAEHINYLLNQIYASISRPVVTRYTSGSGTYNLPVGTTHLRWVVVGGGRGGSVGSAGSGGNGGQAGEIVEGGIVGASLPTSLTYQVGTGGASNTAGGHSWVIDTATSITLAFAAGGGSTPTGAPADIAFAGSMPAGAAGGLGGAGVVGARGTTSRYGAGGGSPGTALSGEGGYGYGAGGGGGRQASGAASGGGGGGGGYGREYLAGNETGNSNGRVGAPGLVMFIAEVTGI